MRNHNCGRHPEVCDYDAEPFIFNINHATNMNHNFRTTLWTGCHMQLTLMCIPVGGNIGVEMYEDVDRFILIESGHTKVYMGNRRHSLCEKPALTGIMQSLFLPHMA